MEGDLFLPPMELSTAAQPAYFRKGIIVSFTPSTGSNSVRVGGEVIPDLPMLVSGSETSFQVGQTVGILVVGTAMFIVGRVVRPNTAAYGSTASAFATAVGTAVDFTVPTSFGTLVSATLNVPAWASKAVILALTRGGANNNQAASINVQTQIAIPGAVGLSGGNYFSVGANAWFSLNFTNLELVNVTPGGTITPRLDTAVDGPAPPMHPDNEVVMTAVGIFTTA